MPLEVAEFPSTDDTTSISNESDKTEENPPRTKIGRVP